MGKRREDGGETRSVRPGDAIGAVAVAMVRGPAAGLRLLESLDGDERIRKHHRLPAVRAHLLEMDGQPGPARVEYLAAARRTASGPEKRYLEAKAAALGEG